MRYADQEDRFGLISPVDKYSVTDPDYEKFKILANIHLGNNPKDIYKAGGHLHFCVDKIKGHIASSTSNPYNNV